MTQRPSRPNVIIVLTDDQGCGDHYPFPPEDRGFQEVVRHCARGITSVLDFWLNDYFEDSYRHNGCIEHYEGYGTDLWLREAMDWMCLCGADGEPFLA